MRKYVIVLAVVVLAGLFTACGVNVGGASSAPVSSAVSSQISQDSVEDNLSGLQKYLVGAAEFSGDASKMGANIIGAKSGVKYVFGHNGKNNVTAELYEFDTANLNDTAKKVISEVKDKGSFTIMDQQINAVLSDSGKYLLIYKNNSTDDENKKYDKNVAEMFKAFKK